MLLQQQANNFILLLGGNRMSIGIYKITNKINGKSYIGLSTNIEERFKKHRQSQGDKVLYSAFEKYGIENFDFSILELCSIDELGEREKYWIAYYDTYYNGYNATLGGEGNCKIEHQKVIQDFLKTGSCKETADNLGITPHTVGHILTSNNISHRTSSECGGLNKKRVAQFTKKGEFVQEFSSQEEAAKYLIDVGKTKASINTVRGHIGQNCAGKEKSSYGFVWKWL
jgi:group I intron endonuclease